MTASTRFESVDQARQLTERITAVPGIDALSGGNFGTVATYFPGERVTGVRIEDKDGVDTLAVHVVIAHDFQGNLRELAQKVRQSATFVGLPVDVYIEDIAEAPISEPEAQSEPEQLALPHTVEA